MEEEKLRLLKEMKEEKMAFLTAFLTTWKKVNKQLLQTTFAVFPYIHVIYVLEMF